MNRDNINTFWTLIEFAFIIAAVVALWRTYGAAIGLTAAAIGFPAWRRI